jgi:hypothetical protein
MSIARAQTKEAFRRLKPYIDKTYPYGWFVALEGETIIADAQTIDELAGIVLKMGRKPPETFMVQAGFEYPEYAVILGLDLLPCV